MNLLDAIAKSIDITDFVTAAPNSVAIANYAAAEATAKLSRSAQKTNAASIKPVIQFNPFPITLDSNIYMNPRSSRNPNGDLRSLFAFRQLVDPVPSFSRYYSPSGASTEAIYRVIIEGASVRVDSSFTKSLIADIRKQFQENQFEDMDGTPGQWCPVYAVPEDWHDTSQGGRYKQIDIDLNDQGGKDSPFTVIGGQSALELLVGEDLDSPVSIDPQTKIRSTKMKYLLVQFRRPWLNFMLFKSGGWWLSGQPQGFCSSGNNNKNSGVLPLLPTGMLLAKDISIDVKWSKTDQAFIDSAQSSRRPVSLGPLPLCSQGSSSSLQLIAWVSSLVPFSPS